jgi:hypothetical protein
MFGWKRSQAMSQMPKGTVLIARRASDSGEQATKDISRLVGDMKLLLKRRSPQADIIPGYLVRPAQPSPSLQFLDDVSDQLLGLMPHKYRERAYEPAKCDADASRLERFEKDGNDLAANREYRRVIRKLVLSTFLTLPRFYLDEIWSQIRRRVAR